MSIISRILVDSLDNFSREIHTVLYGLFCVLE